MLLISTRYYVVIISKTNRLDGYRLLLRHQLSSISLRHVVSCSILLRRSAASLRRAANSLKLVSLPLCDSSAAASFHEVRDSSPRVPISLAISNAFRRSELSKSQRRASVASAMSLPCSSTVTECQFHAAWLKERTSCEPLAAKQSKSFDVEYAFLKSCCYYQIMFYISCVACVSRK